MGTGLFGTDNSHNYPGNWDPRWKYGPQAADPTQGVAGSAGSLGNPVVPGQGIGASAGAIPVQGSTQTLPSNAQGQPITARSSQQANPSNAGGGIGGAVADATGTTVPQQDPLNFGGYSGGAADWTAAYVKAGLSAKNAGDLQATYARNNGAATSQHLNQQADNGMNVTAPTIRGTTVQGTNVQGTNIDQSVSNQSLGNANAARQNQSDSLGLMASAAHGDQPSVAQLQQSKGIADAMHAQLTAGASARGGAMQQAAAQQGAAQQAENLQAQGVGQSAQLRASEMATARGQYSDAATQQRASDLQTMGMTAQQAQAQATLEAQQHSQQAGISSANAAQQAGIDANSALHQADLTQNQLQQNRQYGLGSETLANAAYNDAQKQALGYTTLGDSANQAYQGMAFNVNQSQLGAKETEQGLAQQANIANSNANAAGTSAALGGLGTAASLLPLLFL